MPLFLLVTNGHQYPAEVGPYETVLSWGDPMGRLKPILSWNQIR